MQINREMLRLESLAREQPNNHSAAALHLVPQGRPQAFDRVKCLMSLKAAGEQKTDYSLVGATIPATWPTGGGVAIEMLVPARPPASIFFGVFDEAVL